MSDSAWYLAVKKLKEFIVKIETPDGHGTGFLSLPLLGNMVFVVLRLQIMLSNMLISGQNRFVSYIPFRGGRFF